MIYEKDCLAGTYSGAGAATKCTQCELGRSLSSNNRGACDVCATGKQQSVEGQTTCSACVPGRFSIVACFCLSIITCVCYETINYLFNRARFCQSLLASPLHLRLHTHFVFFPFFLSSNHCLSCLAFANKHSLTLSSFFSSFLGRIAPTSETVNCALCVEGRYQSTGEQTTCEACDAGFWTDTAGGASVCVACVPGRVWIDGTVGCQVGAITSQSLLSITTLRCYQILTLHSFFLFICIFSFMHSFIYSFIHLFIYSFIHSFIYSFIYLFIHSFIHLFIHSCQQFPRSGVVWQRHRHRRRRAVDGQVSRDARDQSAQL
jgi:hypothetical protein